ncbi:hypothetical protein SOASR015_15720 [Pectobacterium carotovorum subsp. carotovorum]|nr:hypothetical protein SOASR015_15720 [Pectobacterium carotovorum subsp. carotovorum]GLX57132.1 hypothetical protein Pcaca02_24410 [Pectobacterium carotovorum subsp. carotovorum]
MKYFSTGFYLKTGSTSQDVINECLTWVSGSPHTSFTPAVLDMQRGNSAFDIEAENEKIEVIFCSENEVDMYCFRYSKISGPHKWVTDISTNEYRKDGSVWIQVESNVYAQQAVYKAPKTKRPLIVMLLLDKFSGGKDDNFTIGVEPVYLNDSQEGLEKATNLINAKTSNRLPVVYVSSKYYYREHAHNLIPERMARKLAGLAHVMIEPDGAKFSNKLKFMVGSKNAYGGAVGIYWPNGQGISIHKRGEKTATDFEDLIFDEVIMAITSLTPLRKNGWVEINNAKTRKSIQSLKEAGSNSVELISLYEEDNVYLRDEVKELSLKIQNLESRIRILTDKSSVQGDISINIGAEDDLFDGEIFEIIISTLNKSLSTLHEKSRFHDVISSIINTNKIDGIIDVHDKELKQAMIGYRSMTPKLQATLKKIGFSINDEGKHLKLVYHDDPRYTYILPKTGSDRRGSLNAYSDISNIIYN